MEHMADGTCERAVPAGSVIAAQDALATEVNTGRQEGHLLASEYWVWARIA